MLLEHEANIETSYEPGETPLVCAVQGEREEALSLLLQYGAKVEVAAYTTYKTEAVAPMVLYWAVSGGIHAGVRLLLQYGADIEALCEGKTPIHGAVKAMNNKALTLLLEHGANIEARDTLGNTPLHRLLLEPLSTRLDDLKVKVARILLHHNADVHAANHNGDSPLSLAEKLNSHCLASLLQEEAYIDPLLTGNGVDLEKEKRQ